MIMQNSDTLYVHEATLSKVDCLWHHYFDTFARFYFLTWKKKKLERG